jgi:nucleotide-binding universal stress UspA family protein
MRRILLLTDFSEAANNAMAYAQNFWADFDCQFHLMHVISSGGYTTESLLAGNPNEDLYTALLKKAKSKLKKTFEALEAQNTNPRHHFKYHVDHDVFLDAVHQLVTKESIDVVVLGSNGASNVKEVLFGTHALNTMRRLPHNILVVPDGFKYQPIERFLLLLDTQDRLNELHVSRITDLVNTLEVDLHILSVNPLDKSNDQLIEKVFESVATHHKINDVPLEHAASTYVQTHGISLILMVGEMAGFVDRLRGNQGKTNLSKLYQTPLFLIRR